MIAKVVVNRPVKGHFDYEIPLKFKNKIKRGQRVKIRFGSSKAIGYVVGIYQESKIKKLRNIEEIIDNEPILDAHLLRLTEEVSKYYLCSWGEVLDAVFPSGLKKNKIILKTDKALKKDIEK